jgi:carboxymethylenebutenolidase
MRTAGNIFKRIVMVGLIVMGVAVLGLAGLVAYDTVFPAQRASDFTNTTFTAPDGIERTGYLARPSGPGPHPAVLVVHEFYGINADVTKKADLLAQQGYIAFAPDAYRGATTTLIPRAIWLVSTTPQDQIRADLDAAYRYLTALEGVDPLRVGAVGFCFGGTQVMHLATRTPDLRAAVIFYGNGPIADPQALGVMGQSGPVLGIYGEQDTGIPIEEVRAFEAAMDLRGVPNQVSIYPGVGHAFVNTETLARPGQAQLAWQQMLAFLNENLGTAQ